MVPSRPATATARPFQERPSGGGAAVAVGAALRPEGDAASVRVTVRRVIGEVPLSQRVTPSGSWSYRRAKRYAERMSGIRRLRNASRIAAGALINSAISEM